MALHRMSFRKAGPLPEPKAEESVSPPPAYCPFTIFGITVRVPGRWLAYPQQNRERLSWNTGFFKFEECADPASACSLGVQWQTRETTAADFLGEYPRQMEKQYSSQLKKQARFVLLEESVAEPEGAEPRCLLQCEYQASSSMLGRSKLTAISILNTGHYCERTHRVLVGTIVAHPDQMEAHLEEYRQILFSLRSG